LEKASMGKYAVIGLLEKNCDTEVRWPSVKHSLTLNVRTEVKKMGKITQ